MSNPLATVDQEILGWVIVAILTPLAVGIIVFTGSWRPRRVLGPTRARCDEPIVPLVAAVFAGALVWLGSQVVYGAYTGVSRVEPQVATSQPTLDHPTTASSGGLESPEPTSRITDQSSASKPAATLRPQDLAVLSTVPPILGAAVVVLMLMGAPGWLHSVGLTAHKLPAAVGLGVVGILVSYPLVFWALQLIERIYAALSYEHPTEHEILHQLGSEPAGGLKAALVLGATVAAPVFEEIFFRGGLQTILRWLFTRMNARKESPLVAWMAIVGVSVMFAMIHTLWMAPAIFVLSLCLGYLYERTGNLWACIFMHAIFNSANTLLYLAQ